MKKLAMIGLATALLVGCAEGLFKPIEYVTKSKFDEKKAVEQLRSGSASIEGSAFLRQQGGGVVTCAGATVSLIPYTEYANERIGTKFGNTMKAYHDAVYSPKYKFVNTDPLYYQYTKQATCDAQGKFTFNNLAEGNYFLITKVTWTIGYNLQGGELMQQVKLGKKEIKNVVMSQ